MRYFGPSISEEVFSDCFHEVVFNFIAQDTSSIKIKEDSYETHIILNKKSEYLQIQLASVVKKASYLKKKQKNCDCILIDISRSNIFIIEAKKSGSCGSGSQINASYDWTTHLLNCIKTETESIDYTVFFVTSVFKSAGKSRQTDIKKSENWIQCFGESFSLNKVESFLKK